MEREIPNRKDGPSSCPRVLLMDTNRWPVTPRLAIAFSKMGCSVAAICPLPGHPIQKTSVLERVFKYSGVDPLKSLRKAIEAFNPDIVVPSCDQGVQHLHELHALSLSQGAAGKTLKTLIESSLGSPEGFAIVSSRYELLKLARSEGILVPDTIAVSGTSDLASWSDMTAPPWVIKADGTSGGRGVRVAHTAKAAERYFLELTPCARIFELAKRLILNRDRDWVYFNWKRPHSGVIAQLLIDGRPANCAVACWQGEVLAGISVEVIRTQGPTGPATVVEVVEGREMMLAANRIARRLKLSGFFGLDFMIEDGTGATYLIEMNPRCTPPCPLSLGKGRDPVAAVWAQLTGGAVPENQPVTQMNRIAYFPQAWGGANNLADANPLSGAYHDLPDSEPELIMELLHPWSERSLLGQLLDRARQKWVQEKAPAAKPAGF